MGERGENDRLYRKGLDRGGSLMENDPQKEIGSAEHHCSNFGPWKEKPHKLRKKEREEKKS